MRYFCFLQNTLLSLFWSLLFIWLFSSVWMTLISSYFKMRYLREAMSVWGLLTVIFTVFDLAGSFIEKLLILVSCIFPLGLVKYPREGVSNPLPKGCGWRQHSGNWGRKQRWGSQYSLLDSSFAAVPSPSLGWERGNYMADWSGYPLVLKPTFNQAPVFSCTLPPL